MRCETLWCILCSRRRVLPRRFQFSVRLYDHQTYGNVPHELSVYSTSKPTAMSLHGLSMSSKDHWQYGNVATWLSERLQNPRLYKLAALLLRIWAQKEKRLENVTPILTNQNLILEETEARLNSWNFVTIPPTTLWPLGSTQPLTEMCTRNLPGGEGRPARKADVTAICEMLV
jgi:hypothetical protein